MKTQDKKIKRAYKEGGQTVRPMVTSISQEKKEESDPSQYQEKIDEGVRSDKKGNQ